MVQKTTPERHAALRETLLAIAERIVATRGLAALRTRDLTQEAGCAVGALYTVFPDLDALILAVNGRTLALLAAQLHAVTARKDQGPLERLVAKAEAYLDFAIDHQPRWVALFTHRMPQGEPVPIWYRKEQHGVFALVERELAALRPDFGAEQLALLARTIFAAVHGVITLGIDRKLGSLPAATLREQTRLTVELMARGITARE